jgi:hypothetical protein
MFRKGMQQTMMLALSLVLMASAPVLAAGRHHETQAAAVAHEGSFTTRAWQWMQALWAEQGACIDPEGRCTSAVSAPQADTDRGACIDPNGRCAASLHRP